MKNLNTLIDQWIGEEKEITNFNWPYASRQNEVIQDLKSRKQELVEGIGKLIVDELAERKWDIKTETGIITGLSMPKIRETIKELTSNSCESQTPL